MLLAIIISLLSMGFTMFCGIKYIHPGSHRGYADSNHRIAWKDVIKNKWWEYRDIPLPVKTFSAWVIRTWWWLATGTNLKVWAAIHRHNSIHEKKVWPKDKPTSRLARAKLYPVFAKNKRLVDQYSIEVPDTWVDRNIFYSLPLLGPVVLFFIFYTVLGLWAFIPWIAQLLWMPFWRSESVNGWLPKEHEWNRLFHQIKDREFCL